MLIYITKENYSLRYRGYGIVEIPQATKVVMKKTAEKPDGEYCLSELDWIDERYPQIAASLKKDIEKRPIPIPNNYLILALRIRFSHDNCGYCRDVYKSIKDPNKLYCRMETRTQDTVQWLTMTPDWEEPDCPLRTDMLIQIMDNKGKVIISEQQSKDEQTAEFRTKKQYPFSWENASTSIEEELIKRIY